MLTGKPSSLCDRNNHDWAPSQYLGHQSVEKLDIQRYPRVNEREEKQRRSECAAALSALSAQTTRAELEESMTIAESQMDSWETKNTNKSRIVEMETEVHRLTAENIALKATLKEIRMDEHSLVNDNYRVLFYTSLPNWMLLSAVFNLVQPFLCKSSNCMVKIWQTDLKISINRLFHGYSYVFLMCCIIG